MKKHNILDTAYSTEPTAVIFTLTGEEICNECRKRLVERLEKDGGNSSGLSHVDCTIKRVKHDDGSYINEVAIAAFIYKNNSSAVDAPNDDIADHIKWQLENAHQYKLKNRYLKGLSPYISNHPNIQVGKSHVIVYMDIFKVIGMMLSINPDDNLYNLNIIADYVGKDVIIKAMKSIKPKDNKKGSNSQKELLRYYR